MNQPTGKLLLRNATVVLPKRIIQHGTILVEGGYISSIGAGGISDAEIIDLGGMTVLPGFIDVHIHGAVGVDVMDATTAELGEVSK
jgi:N-acetylglucosamine-6-phosphate deacetylase